MLEVMFCICNTVCMILIGEWTYHWTVKTPRKFIHAGLLYIFALLFKFVLFPKLFGIFYILDFIAWFMICEGAWARKLLNMIMLYFATGFVDTIVDIVIDIVFLRSLSSEIKDFICIGALAIIVYAICKLQWYQKLIRYLNSISIVKYLLILFVLIFSIVIAVLGDMLHGELNNDIVTMIFRVSIAIELSAIFVVIIWLVSENYQKKYYLEKNVLKDEVIRTQQAYYDILCEKDREIRSFRHDMASQIGMLQMLLEQDDVAGAKDYLNRIHQEFEQSSFRKIHVGEKRLDAILSMMNQKASEKGVQLEIAGELQMGADYDVYELCTVFSNAINNAIEACDKQEDNKKVVVKLLNHNHTLCCRFENPATEEMYQNLLRGETSKVNKKEHGYGVRNIRNAVERLEGSMEYQYQDGRMILEICI